MTDVVIQVAPAQAHSDVVEPIVLVATMNTVTPVYVIKQVPLVTTISIGDSSISAVPNPFLAGRGV
jgi:hypothetical protein